MKAPDIRKVYSTARRILATSGGKDAAEARIWDQINKAKSSRTRLFWSMVRVAIDNVNVFQNMKKNPRKRPATAKRGAATSRVIRRTRRSLRRTAWGKTATDPRRSKMKRTRKGIRFGLRANPSRGPHVWQIVAEIRPGQPGAEYGVDAVTPQNWIVTRKPVTGREYGYTLPDALTKSAGFRDFMAGKRRRLVYGSLAAIKNTFRGMLG